MGTQAWWQTNWLWHTTGWTLCAIGLALLFWSLFRDRSRNRRRCPKCWYDMSGIPALTCPECGRQSKHEKHLLRTRRRWRWAAASIFLLSLSYVSYHASAVWSGSWVGLVPSTVLMLSAPTDCGVEYVPPAPPPVASPTRNAIGSAALIDSPDSQTLWMSSRPRPPLPAPPAPKSINEALGREAWMRLQKGEMWGWQARWFIGRALESDRGAWEKYVAIPARWVAGSQMPVRIADGQPNPGWQMWMGHNRRLSMPIGDTTPFVLTMQDTPRQPGTVFHPSVEFHAARKQRFETTFSMPCQLLASPQDLFTLDASEELAEIASVYLNPRLVREENGEVQLIVNERYNHPAWERLRTGLGCRLEITLDGRVLGTAEFTPSWKFCSNWYSTEVPVTWRADSASSLRAADANPRIHMTGDPNLSFIAYTEWPFDDPKPKCWTGHAEVDAPIRPKQSETRKLGERKPLGKK